MTSNDMLRYLELKKKDTLTVVQAEDFQRVLTDLIVDEFDITIDYIIDDCNENAGEVLFEQYNLLLDEVHSTDLPTNMKKDILDLLKHEYNDAISYLINYYREELECYED